MQKFVSIDIGGTHIKSGTVYADGTVISGKTASTPVAADSETFLNLLVELITHLDKDCDAIGVSVLGTWDEKRGCVTGACDNLPVLCGMPLRAFLQQQFGKPVHVLNDVNAAALGEAFWGAGRTEEQFYCMTLGTGIGGAFVTHKTLLCGKSGQAGEIGYLHSGAATYESCASTRAFLRRCRESCPCDGLDDRALFEAALRGNAVYRPVFEAWVRDVAAGICELVFVLDPGTVIIGGGVSEHGNALTNCIQAALDAQLPADFAGKTRVVPAELGNAACLLGAIAAFCK